MANQKPNTSKGYGSMEDSKQRDKKTGRSSSSSVKSSGRKSESSSSRSR